MNQDSWLSRMKLRRKQKQEMKMREKFSFLLEINDSVETINNSIGELSSALQISNDKIQKLTADLRTQNIRNQEATKELLDLAISKVEKLDTSIAEARKQTEAIIEDKTDILLEIKDAAGKLSNSIDELNSALQSSDDKIQESAADLKTQYISNQDETRALIRSVVDKLEKTDTCMADMQRQTESVIKNQADAVTFSIEEVKSLLQLLAVNDLLDEICVEKVKK